jgi:hypothetical protein
MLPSWSATYDATTQRTSVNNPDGELQHTYQSNGMLETRIHREKSEGGVQLRSFRACESYQPASGVDGRGRCVPERQPVLRRGVPLRAHQDNWGRLTTAAWVTLSGGMSIYLLDTASLVEPD